MSSLMTFQEKLKNNKKVITAEITPPRDGSPLHFIKTSQVLKSSFDALNVTDNQRALMRMSNLACAALLEREGVEAIYQLTCRDRNSLALQADLLGAQGLGIKNVLCLTGDPVKAGHFSEAKGVFEFESVGLLKMIAQMRAGQDSAGKNLTSPLEMFPGAVVNPSVKNPLVQIKRMEKKIEAGAKFFQTQAVFSEALMEQFMKQVEHLKVPVIAGILLVRSMKTAKFLQEKVPGVFVPEDMFKALENSTDQAQAGLEYATQLSQRLLKMCQGVHLMAIKDEEILVDIVEKGQLKKIN